MKPSFLLPFSLLLSIAFNSAAQSNLPPLVSSGTVVRHWINSTIVDSRYIDVWLPNDYNPALKYNVLYMHDGQALFDPTKSPNGREWNVDSTMGALLVTQKIDATIVVSIYNNGPKRWSEYFPGKVIPTIPEPQRTQLTGFTGVSTSDDYLRFIVTELKPFIDSAYSTLPGQEHTYIAGASLGGLISMYAFCEYPGVFSRAACLSNHWIGVDRDNPEIAAALLKYFELHLPKAEGRRIYFDYGTIGFDRFYGPYQKKADTILESKGYSPVSWKTQFFPGADHSENAWRARFGVPASFILSGSLQTKPGETKLIIYPNPAQQNIFFRNYEQAEGKYCQVFNSNGQLVYGHVINKNRIDVSQLAAGLYFIRIENRSAGIVKI